MGRRAARNEAMVLLYQYEIHREGFREQFENEMEQYEFSDSDLCYIREVVEGTLENMDEFDKIIINHLRGWKLSRLSKIDLSILRLSVFEIFKRQDIPENVSINEAVELAKKFSGEESASFINGVLSSILNENIENEKRKD